MKMKRRAVKGPEQMERAARLHLLRVLERQPGALSQAEADRIATEAKHRTRQRKRA